MIFSFDGTLCILGECKQICTPCSKTLRGERTDVVKIVEVTTFVVEISEISELDCPFEGILVIVVLDYYCDVVIVIDRISDVSNII